MLNKIDSNKTYTDLYGDHANNVVVFGNPDVPMEFQAHVKVEVWNEDSISFCEEGIKGKSSLKDETIILDLGKRKFQWYKGKQGKILHWVEVLNEKPATNKWSLKIADAGQFDYFYQTPLAELSAKIPGSRIEYVTEDGKEHIHLIYPEGGSLIMDGRPLDVDGSIAVYHKTKKNHCLGGVNYETGKALHILRPKAIDKNGKWVWCDIQVKDDIYTRTTPQSFLDSAAYPVIINDNFGTGTYGGSYTSPGFNSQHASDKGSPASSGSATSITFYARFVNDTIVATAGFWNDNSGVPGTLVADASEVTNIGGADLTQWWPSNLDNATAINSANSYWLGINQEIGSGLLRWHYDDTAQNLYREGLTYVSGTLDDFGTPVDTDVDRNQSIYLIYTPSVDGNAGIMTPNTGFWGPTF